MCKSAIDIIYVARGLAGAMSDKTPIRIVYDGECPFCTRYAKMLRLKESYDVDLIDARGDHPIIAEITARKMDLDKGMVVKLDGQYFYGGDAVNRLAILTDERGAFRKLGKWVFESPTRSRFLYPFLRFGRNTTLKLMGFKKINNIAED